jgi:hypothetical protein
MERQHAACGGNVFVAPDIPMRLEELLAWLRRKGLTGLGDLQDPTRYPQVNECARCGQRWPLQQERRDRD